MIENEIQRAWAAGLIEGEGCFSSNKIRQGARFYVYPVFALASNDQDTVERAGDLLELSVYSYTQKTTFSGGQHWRIAAFGHRAVEIMLTFRDMMGQRRKAKIDELLAMPFGRQDV